MRGERRKLSSTVDGAEVGREASCCSLYIFPTLSLPPASRGGGGRKSKFLISLSLSHFTRTYDSPCGSLRRTRPPPDTSPVTSRSSYLLPRDFTPVLLVPHPRFVRMFAFRLAYLLGQHLSTVDDNRWLFKAYAAFMQDWTVVRSAFSGRLQVAWSSFSVVAIVIFCATEGRHRRTWRILQIVLFILLVEGAQFGT
jgi:hypothetical protein